MKNKFWIKIFIALAIILFTYALFADEYLLHPSSLTQNPANKKYIILSIDGGGVRGIIPARILQEIEKQTGKQIYQMVDTISGNSTGGIIALALVAPNQNKVDSSLSHNKFNAKDLVDLYRNQSKDIFQKSFLRNIKIGYGAWGPRYDRSNLDKILSNKFGNTMLSETLKPVLIFSFSLNTSEGHIWNSQLSKQNPQKDFYLKDIAAATSAAPTYFAPSKFSNVQGNYCYKKKDQNGKEVVFRVLSHLFLSILKFPKKSYFGHYAAISNAKFSNVDKLSFAPSI